MKRKSQIIFEVEKFVPCNDERILLNFGKVAINETRQLIFYVHNPNPVYIEIEEI